MGTRPTTEAVHASMEATYQVLQSQLEFMQVQLEQLHTGSNSTGGSVSGGNRQEGEPCQNTDAEGMPSGDEAVRVSSNLRPSISSNGGQQSAEGEALREESCQMPTCNNESGPSHRELRRRRVEALDHHSHARSHQ